jgi:hypothetical protein
MTVLKNKIILFWKNFKIYINGKEEENASDIHYQDISKNYKGKSLSKCANDILNLTHLKNPVSLQYISLTEL